MNAHDEIEERAARWVLRREEDSWSSQDQEALDRWLAESDAHKASYWRLEHGWREADRIGSLGEGSRAGSRRLNVGQWWKPLAIAASLALLFTGVALQPLFRPSGGSEQVRALQFETPVGGHETVALADGSRVELNTDTAIKAAVGHESRTLWLLRGEAYFDVAKDAARPFRIHAGQRTVTVLGTKFAVRRDGAGLAVAVVEGRVRLDQGTGGEQRSTTVTSGEVAVAMATSMTVSSGSAEALQDQLAWRTGTLQLGGRTLADAAGEFNRYNRKQLIVEGLRARNVRIGGSFDARNVEGFARLLQSAYGLKVQPDGDRIVVTD